MTPIHVRPTTALADRALLPGDPGRALQLAQGLLTAPLMFNHHRGLWGYTGEAADGLPLTIQSTGMGGPSAAIVLTELLDLGLRRAIRVGTCGALDDDLELGALLIAESSLAADGTSRSLGAADRVSASPDLTARMRGAAPNTAAGSIVSTDLFYDPDPSRPSIWRRAGARAVEMEAATLFAVASANNAELGCILVVSDRHANGRRLRIDDEHLLTAGLQAGEIALQALA